MTTGPYVHRLYIAGVISAAPALIKELPLPLRRIIGDMSNHDRVVVGLDLPS